MVTTPLEPAAPKPLATPATTSVAEMAEDLRRDLVRAEQAMRALSHDVAGLSPIVAARLKVAAHLVHNAAAALSTDGLSGAT